MAATKKPEISATELELKRRGRRRLIGAVTLGLMAIVFLPMIFDSEPKRAGDPAKTQEISVQVPPKENQPPLSAPTPMASTPVVAAPEAAKATPEAAPVTESAPAAAAPKAVAVVPAKAPEKAVAKEPPKPAAKVEKSEKPEKAAKAEATSKAATLKDGFVVQLGVYTKAENADKEIARMKEAKLPVHTDTIPIKSGNATRVRVGPYATREKAEAALAQIKLAGGEGKIVPTK
jgi:DedD protein